MRTPNADTLADLFGAAIASAIAPLVARVAALESRDAAIPRDGRDGLPGVKGDPGERGQDGRDGLNGTNGTDGANGGPGPPGDPGPPGNDGKDGRDGVTLDLGDVDPNGEFDPDTRIRTIWFVRGDVRVPVRFKDVGYPIHRGTYQAGQTYERGDQLTHKGSVWSALRTTTQRPMEFGDGARDWKLIVKSGQDGKPGPKGDTGPPGQNGRDLTRMMLDGEKY